MKHISVIKGRSGFELAYKEIHHSSVVAKNMSRVRVHFSSINYRDKLACIGNSLVAGKFPYTPGVDFVGKILETNGSSLGKGEWVGGVSIDKNRLHPGGWSQELLVNNDEIVVLPDDIDPLKFITLGTAGYTASLAVNLILNSSAISKKKVDASILVTGANGGVGSSAVKLLSFLDHKVIASSHNLSKKKEKLLIKLGASKVLDYDKITNSSPFPLSPERYAAVIDTVGGAKLLQILKQVKKRGVVIASGNVLGMDLSEFSLEPFLMRGIFFLGTGSEIVTTEEKTAALDLIYRFIRSSDTIADHGTLIKFHQLPSRLSDVLLGRSNKRIVIDFRGD